MSTASKILRDHEFDKVLNFQHRQGVDIVFTNGCFDLIHSGHIALLESAAERGILFVGVNDDESVRLLKGPTRPVNNEMDRMRVVAALECVQAVFLIKDTTVTDSILRIRPSFWIKGGDYSMDTLNKDEVAAAIEVDAEIVLVPAVAGHSTTNTLKRIND
jgi:rfaE bifunctional protein nucleotidyltransferase chain/domain